MSEAHTPPKKQVLTACFFCAQRRDFQPRKIDLKLIKKLVLIKLKLYYIISLININ